MEEIPLETKLLAKADEFYELCFLLIIKLIAVILYRRTLLQDMIEITIIDHYTGRYFDTIEINEENYVYYLKLKIVYILGNRHKHSNVRDINLLYEDKLLDYDVILKDIKISNSLIISMIFSININPPKIKDLYDIRIILKGDNNRFNSDYNNTITTVEIDSTLKRYNKGVGNHLGVKINKVIYMNKKEEIILDDEFIFTEPYTYKKGGIFVIYYKSLVYLL